MKFNNIQKKIIENGVKNLHEFGYPDTTKENILTDFIYSQFFERSLKDNLGYGVDKEINGILDYIKINRKEFGE